ncbi:Hachiman antiphage defense system protein HamA [Fannyhessea vaginae]|uniref:Hachiman antiphage defense system protein HamA n=1 Tax=Fannyhessea vaginae TaxID=82135 RepID=UPI00288B60BD|nr:Hachiman antiphage defense system protein HamA [Fannyhessea vaginae]
MFFDNSKYFIFDRSITTSSGKEIQVYKLNSESLDDNSLNNWALGLRDNYVEQIHLKSLVKGTGLTQKEYLEKNVFPNHQDKIGASTMSGEFGEILVYDYINFVLKYYITRTRYLEKINPNMPVPGSDVIGYKVKNANKPCKSDHLIVAEVKTRSSKVGNKTSLCEKTVTNAIEHSIKDRVRIGESLNAEKRRLLNRLRYDEAKIVERFQNKTDNPFTLDFFAVAVLDNELYSEEMILDAVNSQHENLKSTNVLIIHSKELKLFLRGLYRRACSC